MPGPNDSIAHVFGRIIRSQLTDVWTSVVGTVTAKGEAGFVDVQPRCFRPLPIEDTDDSEHVSESLPVIPNVRVIFLCAAGGFSITMPVDVGTEGLLIVQTVDASEYLAKGQATELGSVALHHLGHALFLPGLTLESALPPAVSAQTPAIVVAGSLVKLGSHAASDFAALASKCDANFDAISNVITSGLTAPGGAGGPVTGGASYVPEPVACTKVQIE